LNITFLNRLRRLFTSELNISDVMFSFYENKYGMLPTEDDYTQEELIIKSFGDYIDDKKLGYEKDDLISGINHGISIVDGSHG
jgi:hypothetical protein